MTYNAVICKIDSISKHPNADRLQICSVAGGFQVITDLNTKVGDLGVYFPVDGQVSLDFATKNNLLEIKDPVTHKKIGGGFMDYKRRIRAMSLRGVKSNGLWLSLSCLSYIKWPIDLPEGHQFTEIDGVQVCKKYYTRATQNAINNAAKSKGKGDYKNHKCLHRHPDTEQFLRFAHEITPGAFVTVTLKMHGTSAVTGYVLEEINLPTWKRLINLIRPTFPTKEYKHRIGTRNVILTEGKEDGYYHDDFRFTLANTFINKLHKGEIIYYEIVGYDSKGKPLMSTHNIKSLKREYPNATKFPEEFPYAYGCAVGTCKAYVYRIAQVNEDGILYDLSWEQVKSRCKQLELDHVPELCKFIYDGNPDNVLRILAPFLSDEELKPSSLDSTHIDEGVCLRIDNGSFHATNYKHKAFLFQVLEGIKKEQDDYIDLEEIS